MRDKIEELIYKNKKILFLIVLLIGLIHQFIGYSKNVYLKKLIVFYFFTILISFISYGVIILQYNFQKKYNPLIKIETLNKFNNFEITCGIVFLAIAVIYDLIISNFHTKDNFIPLFMSSLALSTCLAPIRNKKTYENRNLNEDIQYEKVQNPKKVISIMIMIFGTGWFIAGSGIFIKDEVFKLNAIETTGTVIGYEEHSGSKESITYSTKYSYQDENNVEHIKTGTSASYPPEYTVGTKIKVFYSKKDSNTAIYESKTIAILCSIFGIGGFLILVIGILIYLYSRNEKENT